MTVEERNARLRSVVDYISERSRASRFDMKDWFKRDLEQPRCGTSCCFAGFAAEMERFEPVWHDQNLAPNQRITSRIKDSDSGNIHESVYRWAKQYFNLTDTEASKLFYLTSWPVGMWTRMQTAKTPEQKVALLRERVEHFISTNL